MQDNTKINVRQLDLSAEYKAEYNKGWGTKRVGIPDVCSDAWEDGYMDRAAGRAKWHTPACAAGQLVCEEHAPAADDDEQPADAVKDWTGNYNTVFAPAAEYFATEGQKVETVAVKTMLKQSHVTGDGAAELVEALTTVEAEAKAALRDWQKTLDRKGQTDMEKYNQNRSFLAGFVAVAAQQHTGAKKRPTVAFAADMARAIRPDALKAGAAARKKETR